MLRNDIDSQAHGLHRSASRHRLRARFCQCRTTYSAYRRSFTAARATPSLPDPRAVPQPRRSRAAAGRAAPRCNGVLRRRNLQQSCCAVAGPRAVQHHVPGAALGAPAGGAGGAGARRAPLEVFSAAVWPRSRRRAAAAAASRRVIARFACMAWHRRGVSGQRVCGALTGGPPLRCAPFSRLFAASARRAAQRQPWRAEPDPVPRHLHQLRLVRAAPRGSAPPRPLTPPPLPLPRRRWCLYGCLRGDFYVFFSNSQGVVLGVWFTLSTLPLMDAKARRTPSPFHATLRPEGSHAGSPRRAGG